MECVADERITDEFAAPAVSKPEPTIRVLSIVGAGRSGSTLLDTVLGSHPEVVGVGELVNLHRLGWLGGDFCACGRFASDCPFWSRVRQEWQRRIPFANVADYLRLQDRFERVHLFGLSRWMRFFKERRWPSRAYRDYLRQTEALFRAIAVVSGRAIIVDSSKTPLRAALLAQISGLDVRFLHLIRDARAVAWSRRRTFKADLRAGITREFRPKPTWVSVGYWVWVNLLSLCVCHGNSTKSLQVRYEDFVSNPAATLERIGTWSGLEYSSTTQALLDGEPLHPEHTIAGNRLRMSGHVTLKPDWEWTDKLRLWDGVVCWLMAGWLLKRFGYSRRSQQAAGDGRQAVSKGMP